MNNNNDIELIIATKNQNLKKIKKLINNGANINGIWYGKTPLIYAAKNGYPKIVEKLAYAIYEQEKWKRYQLQLPNFINISTDKNVKTLQELANDVQKTITGIDFKDPSPYQKLEINLNLVKLKINNEILNKINKRIEKKKSSLVKKANAINLQNEVVRGNKNNYCFIL